MRRRYLLRAWRSERGSQGLEAAGAALAAALIVLALLAGARSTLGPRVVEAFQCAAAALGGGGGGCGAGAAVADGTGTAPQPDKQQDKGAFSLLDGLQLGLDAVGLVPGLGEVADGVNGMISLARGDKTGAALSFAAMVPFAGWAATGGKFVRTGVKYSDEAAGAAKYSDEAATVGRRADDIPPGCAIGQQPSGKAPGLAKPLAGCKEIGPNPDVSKLKRKISQPDPSKIERGTWDGNTFHPNNPKAKPGETPLSEKYPDGVTFDKDGFPDFTAYAKVNPTTGTPDVYQIERRLRHRAERRFRQSESCSRLHRNARWLYLASPSGPQDDGSRAQRPPRWSSAYWWDINHQGARNITMSATITRSGAPLSTEQISEVEQRIGAAIPSAYHEFLLQYNGGRPVPNAFFYRHSDGTTAGEAGVNTFLGIGDADSTDIEWHHNMYEDRIPDHFLPIADDPGGNLICLLTAGDDAGAVYFWDHEEESDPPTYDNVYVIAPDFQTFLDTLFEAT